MGEGVGRPVRREDTGKQSSQQLFCDALRLAWLSVPMRHLSIISTALGSSCRENFPVEHQHHKLENICCPIQQGIAGASVSWAGGLAFFDVFWDFGQDALPL